ncbi:hypothetical protein IAQ61_009730 [Plenodomus lingam]|uniref:uncharacterized protein n=1 Tax=Leptosphaeria maculans TaxID=5022 RepID=UPI003316FB36|nr:hypothetical protein IAQ61_009730 [Plenodomus lingam]
MVDRDLPSADGALQRGDIIEEESDGDGENHGGEDCPILGGDEGVSLSLPLVFDGEVVYLCCFVEKGGLLEEAEAASACCEEVEELPFMTSLA